MNPDFLLDTPAARHLYHDVAEQLPIIDYHCHLSPKDIALDKKFRSITELWLGGDHYKWRAMRANGVDERFITGDASDWEKFEKWAETVPYTLRNPLYHWTQLELSSAFGIDEPLNPASARRIYDACNEQLADASMSARGLMRRYGVELVCTTDDPVDSLEWHKIIRESEFEVKVLPAWRPDKAMAVTDPKQYAAYIGRLGRAAGVEITDYDTLMQALAVRMDFFASQGCLLADHGLGRFPYREYSARNYFERVLAGEELEPNEIEELQSAILLDLCSMNHDHGWAQQFHFGALRNVNTKAYEKLGPDIGCDSIADGSNAEACGKLLDELNSRGSLTRTIIYNLNPADNAWVATMIGNFQMDAGMPGKMQMGSGWWFNDQLFGMQAQIDTLSMQGLLSRFVGMLTDSRSFLSYPRHEYFRRLLCRILGHDIEQGMIPASEMARVEEMVGDICYRNAKSYFKF